MDLEFHELVWLATSLGVSFLIGLVAFIVMMGDDGSNGPRRKVGAQ